MKINPTRDLKTSVRIEDNCRKESKEEENDSN
jgi:hypothetical protein